MTACDGNTLGGCIVRAVQPESSDTERRSHVVCLLAAWDAEGLLDPDEELDARSVVERMPWEDVEKAIKFAEECANGDEIAGKVIYDEASRIALEMVTQFRVDIETVAERLLVSRKLTGLEVKEMLRDANR